MIEELLALALFVLFSAMSGIHFYWLFGGKWALTKVIPTSENDGTFRPPPALATLLVALVLMSFGLIYLVRSRLVTFELFYQPIQYLLWIIPSVFLLRAIGEFKYVGFFKSIKATEFAKSDTLYFSPLCLLISIIGFILRAIYSFP